MSDPSMSPDGVTVTQGQVLAVLDSTVTNGVETSSTIGTGTLAFDGGTLQAGANNLVFANTAAVNAAGGAFDVNGNTLTWDGAISDGTGSPAGGLTVTDSSAGPKGTLVLGAANSFSGGLTVTGGATVDLEHEDQNDNFDVLGSGAVTVNGGEITAGAFTASSPTFTANEFNNALHIGAGGAVFTDTNGNSSFEFQGAITGTGQLTFTGADASFALYSADAGFSGVTSVSGGADLVAEPNNTLAAHSDYRVDSGSALVISQGENTTVTSMTETIGSLSDGPDGGGFVKGRSNVNATVILGDSVNSTFSGVISEHTQGRLGTLALVKQGTDTFTEAGANTYSGGTTINAGTLELDASTTLSGGVITSGAAGTGAIHFGGAGTLLVDGVALNAGDLAYAITGFASGDVIDVRGIGQTDTAVYDASTGTLSLEHGTTIDATLHIGTGYGDDVFTAASDLNGGVEVAVGPAPPSGGGGGGGSSGGGGGGTTGGGGSAGSGSGGGIDETLGSGPASLQGSDSADSLGAGSGADTLLGGGGDDSLTGGSGSDQLYGNAGNDTITLTAMTQSSTVYGGQGDDTIDASASTHANFISGDLGNDTIILGSGADTAYAGSGNDSITAGSGQDQIYGNAGDDHVSLGAASGASTVYAGQGNDAIDASSSTHNDFISGDLGNDTITLGSGADTAYGGDGDDSITAGSGSAQIYGNAGDDHISLVASSASSTVYAGQGNDTIDASASTHANYISGDLGDDIIIAGSGGDTIHGGAGSDTIQASASGATYIHTGLADSSATSATGASALDHVLGFNSQTKLIFDGDPAATSANTAFHGGDSAITNYAAAYAYAYGNGASQGAITGAVDYAVVSDSAGHVYVFAQDHAAVEIDGLASGVSGVVAGQILAS